MTRWAVAIGGTGGVDVVSMSPCISADGVASAEIQDIEPRMHLLPLMLEQP
jgi:hypothetical protein